MILKFRMDRQRDTFMKTRFPASWPRAVVAAFAAAAIVSITFSSASVASSGTGPGRVSMQTEPPATPAASADRPARETSPLDGFYLRAGVSREWSKNSRFTDRECSSTNPAALYGCGEGNDGAPLHSVGDFGTMTGFELGLGRVVSPLARFEAAVEYRPRFSFDGRSNFQGIPTSFRQAASADLSTLSALVSAYLDLLGLGAPEFGPFSPFVGGGIGISRIDIDETRMEFPKTTTIVPGRHSVNFTWMLTAGATTTVGEGINLDIAWRYTDSGSVETGRGQGRVVWRDRSREPVVLNLDEAHADLKSHGLHVSMRYAF